MEIDSKIKAIKAARAKIKAWKKGFCSPRTHFINSAHIYNRPTCREQRLYGARLTFVYKTKIVPKKSISACWTLVHPLWELLHAKGGVRSFEGPVCGFCSA